MSDYIVRATAADLRIRAFAATTRDMVEYARAAHDTSPVMTAALGRLLTAGAMMGVTMKADDDLLTLRIEGDGPAGGVCVTADSHGNVKGYVNNPKVLIPAKPNHKLDVSGAIGSGTLQVIKDIGLKDPYVGQVNLVSGEIAEDITYYYAVSEQVPSTVALGVLMDHDNTVKCAGGFMIQLMPDAGEEVISALEEKLKGFTSITALLEDGKTPEDILAMFLGDMGLEITEREECRFKCNCSKDRFARGLISLGSKELNSLIEENEPIEVNCHFCSKKYTYSVEELRELLKNVTH
ncbi:MAG: Hsp33 family molecular chaperone HslO [Lachnospiraceae bacterium]|nr:Hsp33 family molecular chaperone HslO [Lachnospiraceae bacterium]